MIFVDDAIFVFYRPKAIAADSVLKADNENLIKENERLRAQLATKN